MDSQMTQEEFDKLSVKMFNKRIGDFLYQHYEAHPRYHRFYDMHGNEVMHIGRPDGTDVYVRIKKEHLAVLEPRLITYLKNLVGRHGEALHEQGQKQFYGATIRLPYHALDNLTIPREWVVHTGSGCSYDQDEIAYEIIAALSDMSALKAVAPTSRYYGFIRIDDPKNGFQRIEYKSSKVGVTVDFSHTEAISAVVITMDKQESVESKNKFKRVIYEFLTKYVEAKTGKKLICEEGHALYKGDTHWDDRMVGLYSPKFDTDGVPIFSVTVPYGGETSFARVKFAKAVMNTLYDEFKIEQSEEVETA